MPNPNSVIAPSLVALINRDPGGWRSGIPTPDAESLLQLAQLQPGTVGFALITRARAAFDQRQFQAAFRFFLAAYASFADPDPRLLEWMARAAREQGQPAAADQLDQLFRRKRPTPPAADPAAGSLPAFVPPLPPLPPLTGDPRAEPVDIIIPVYRGRQETLECIHSVLEAHPANGTPHQLVVLNDASPDAALIAAIQQLAIEHQHLSLLHHPLNLGFIRGINRAMARQPSRDVIWLNADTRVHSDWVDRLRAWAYSDPRAASVTPLSNHGELMTFPDPRYRYLMPTAAQSETLDAYARACTTPATAVSLPIGCGFCFYVRRQAFIDVGYLDEDQLAGGYGEETDWCLRASERGWIHLAAANLFIAHHGSISFGDDKGWRVVRNNAVIRKRFPTVDRQFDQFVARDPLAAVRDQLQRARLPELADWIRNTLGPEPRLGSPHPHPRHLHLLGARAVADPRSPFFVPLPESVWAARTAPPELVSLHLRNRGRGLEIFLNAALPGLPLELKYRVDQDLERLEHDLRALPLLGFVQHDPEPALAVLRELLRHLELPQAEPICNTEIDIIPQPPPPLLRQSDNQRCYLIADTLRHPRCRQAWISAARACARPTPASAPWLLMFGGDIWLPELMATGRVLPVRELPGIELSTLLSLSGCSTAVTLAPAEVAGPMRHRLAQRLKLSLCDTFQEIDTCMNAPLPDQPTQESPAEKCFLNIGCGNVASDRLPRLFQNRNWREIRLDINPNVNADIVTHAADLSALTDASISAVYSSHTLEHLEPHQAPVALREIYRVLEADGVALITLPDLQSIARLIVDGKLTEIAYQSPIGPITALDMLYGHRVSIANGAHEMVHQTGFDRQSLGESLLAAGFAEVRIRAGRCFDLWALAFKQQPPADSPWLSSDGFRD